MPLFDNPEVAKQFVRGLGKCTPTRPMEKSKAPCPECKGEMIYSEPGVVHMDPPRKRIRCTECSYKSFEETEAPLEGIDVYQNIIDRQAKRLDKRDPSCEKSSEPCSQNQNSLPADQ